MKIEFKARYVDDVFQTKIGNKHKIKLSNGEIINVATTKEGDLIYGTWWNVSDIDSGLLIVCYNPSPYDYLSKHTNNTERGALLLAKDTLNFAIKDKQCSYKELLNKRFKNVEK